MEEKTLNKQQLEAVAHGHGPLMIIAGAGTGKTTVVTHRIKHLIDSNLATPDQILAITFTEKAAHEMESRLDELLPLGFQVSVHTFHGLCDQVLRDDAFQIGYPQNYTLGSEIELFTLIKSHLWESPLEYFRPLGNPDKFISALLTHVDRLQDENVTVEDYEKWASSLKRDTSESKLESDKYRELASFYRFYQALKLKENVFSFSDLISVSLKLFVNRPNVLSDYRKKWPWILVDEYQDTNYSQTELIKLLAGDNPNLTVVGDDDQSIYKWRGASTSNLISFSKHYPNVKKIILNQNFRSTKEILDCAYRLITHNNPDRLEVQEGVDKKLISVSPIPNPQPVKFFHLQNSESEAETVTSQIQKIKSDNSLAWSDFAVLVRANSHAQPIVSCLERNNIPCRFLGPSTLFQRPEIRNLVSYLDVVQNPLNQIALFQVLCSPWFDIPPIEISRLVSESKQDRIPLIEVVKKSSNKKVANFLALIEEHQLLLAKLSAGEVLYDLLSKTNWIHHLTDYHTQEEESVALNIVKLFNRIKSFESRSNDTSIPAVLAWIETLEQIGESPQAAELDWEGEDTVKIITVHSAKGLEFPVVFICSLVSARFPSINRSEAIPIPDVFIKETLPQADTHLQEERRLFYVAMTRAKSQLILTGADYYGDGKRPKKISQFVSEALSDIDLTTPVPVLQPPVPIHTPPVQISTSTTVTYLDSSRIETFLDCPLHYRAKYDLGLKTPPSASSSFGNTIHKTLKNYYEQLIRGESPDVVKLLEVNWDNRGYENKKREQLFFKRGQDMVKRAITTLPQNPTLLEHGFKFLLTPDLTIGGKIDRVDIVGNKVTIFDYKTSSPNNQLSLKEAQTDLQLSFYALAAAKMVDKPELELVLVYLDSGDRISITKTQEQLDEAVEKIKSIKLQIESSEFGCSHPKICQEGKCDYSKLCRLVVDRSH